MAGEIFKQRREESGRDLKEIALSLKIRYEYLRALEEENFENLPEAVYAKGYIRQYAKFLGIDPDPLIEFYTRQHVTSDGKIPPETSPAEKKFTFSRTLLFVPILFAVAGIIFFVALPGPKSLRQETQFSRIPSLSPDQEERVSEPSVPPSGQDASGQEGGADARGNQERYVLKATATDITWLRVEFNDGVSEEALLRPGESKEWTSQNGFGLKIGNAGGVTLALNGKEMGTLGKKGEVLQLKLPREDVSRN